MNELKLYNEIKNEMRGVIEAEMYSAEWRQEARNRMKGVSALIVAAKKVNKGTEIDQKELIDHIRSEIAAEVADTEGEDTEEAADPDAYPSMDTPD